MPPQYHRKKLNAKLFHDKKLKTDITDTQGVICCIKNSLE